MLKEAQDAGERIVEILDHDPAAGRLTVEVEIGDETARYRIEAVCLDNWKVSKLGHRGLPLAGHVYICRPATLHCECRGRRKGYFRCRHIALLQALAERDYL